jgi:hypothetical protein
MIISSLYGPQFDPTDGTIGTLQCVKRWVLVKGDGNTFYPRQGRHTKATKDEAEALVKAAIRNNGPGTSGHPYVQGLHVEEWWCYPRHFDPIRPVKES